MATWNTARRSETGDLMRLLPCLVSLLVTVSCVSSASAPSATASSTTTRSDVVSPPLTRSLTDAARQPDAADAGSTVWRFAGTLLPPSDPNSYANVILDIEPLEDGGWIVVQDLAPNRRLPSGGPSGGPFIPARGTVLRLNSAGAVVARQSDLGSFSTHVVLFKDSGVVVAEGAGTRGLDIRTLDTLWTTDAECVAVADRCYAYQPNTTSPPGTFEERDPRTFSLIRSLPHIKVGQLTTPMILSNWNLAVVPSKSPDHWFDFFALDPGSPITLPWIDRLRGARSIGLVSGDRAIVSYEGWASGRFPANELTDVATGRVIARYEDRLAMVSTLAATFLTGPTVGELLDPRDSSLGLTLPTLPLYVSFEKGIVVLPLGNGGAAVLRRDAGRSSEHDVGFTEIAEGACPAIDFTRAQLADGTADCPGLAAAAGARRVLVSTGRGRDIDRFDITGVKADEATRRLTIRVGVGEPRSQSLPQSAPAKVVELPESLSGRWLVGLEPDPQIPRPFGFWTAFAIDLH
jgi:hypothetical protein